MEQDRKICVGMIAGAHGVRGLVRLRSFTEDPEAIVEYDPLTDEAGHTTYEITLKSSANDFYVAEIEGVGSREAAEALRGVKLYVSRSQLPKTGKREYYEADLVGLGVKDRQGKEHGVILSVHNYGAGTFLEIGIKKNAGFMLPFTDAFVPDLDLKAGLVTIDPPEGWLETAKPPVKAKKKLPEEGTDA